MHRRFRTAMGLILVAAVLVTPARATSQAPPTTIATFAGGPGFAPGIAALAEGCEFVGIDSDAEYLEIAELGSRERTTTCHCRDAQESESPLLLEPSWARAREGGRGRLGDSYS